MKNYCYYKLLHKLFNKEISEMELIRLRLWLERDPGNLQIFDKANEEYQKNTIYLMPEIFDTEEAWENLSASLGIGSNKVRKKVCQKNKNLRLLSIALSLAVSLGIVRYSVNSENRY